MKVQRRKEFHEISSSRIQVLPCQVLDEAAVLRQLCVAAISPLMYSLVDHHGLHPSQHQHDKHIRCLTLVFTR
jgi:hypothetical protein